MNLATLPLLERLAPCRRILLAGAGGGCDVLSAVPLREALEGPEREVFLASISQSDLVRDEKKRYVVVDADAAHVGERFPESHLSAWYRARGKRVPVYCFKPAGAGGVRNVYEELVRDLALDAVVLVDGGTDSLMRGDEPGLGTPLEDMASVTAVHTLDLPVRLLVNLGFGVDTHHGVCHAHVLEAVADLTRSGAFLGAFSLLPGMPEFQAFREAVAFVNERMARHQSIVATSIVSAAEGHFGDHHVTPRTAGSTLFINPLMSMYWCFEVDGVARRCLYLDYLKDTYTMWDVDRAINNFLYTIEPRPWMDIPL